MLFYSKELIAAAEDPTLIQNTFVLTKIDVQTIRDYNFDSVQGKQFKAKPKKKKRGDSQASLASKSDTDAGADRDQKKGQ